MLTVAQAYTHWMRMSISRNYNITCGTTIEGKSVYFQKQRRRKEYNQVRPHSALGYRSPTPVTILTKVTS
jgi:hypothetical protein